MSRLPRRPHHWGITLRQTPYRSVSFSDLFSYFPETWKDFPNVTKTPYGRLQDKDLNTLVRTPIPSEGSDVHLRDLHQVHVIGFRGRRPPPSTHHHGTWQPFLSHLRENGTNRYLMWLPLFSYQRDYIIKEVSEGERHSRRLECTGVTWTRLRPSTRRELDGLESSGVKKKICCRCLRLNRYWAPWPRRVFKTGV